MDKSSYFGQEKREKIQITKIMKEIGDIITDRNKKYVGGIL